MPKSDEHHDEPEPELRHATEEVDQLKQELSETRKGKAKEVSFLNSS